MFVRMVYHIFARDLGNLWLKRCSLAAIFIICLTIQNVPVQNRAIVGLWNCFFFFFFYISAWTKTLWSWLMTNAQHYLTKPWSGNKQTTAKQVIMIVQKRICKAKWVSLCVCAYVCGCLWDHWYECINICVLLEQWGGTNKSDAVRMEGWHCKRWYREKKRKINNLVNKWEGRERRK